MNLSIDKKKLVKSVYDSLNKKYNKQHVLSVITILFDELIKDLLSGKKIYINNFGEFSTVKTKPRRHMNIVSKQISISTGSTILKFNLNKRVARFLKNKLNIDKTFEGTNDG